MNTKIKKSINRRKTPEKNEILSTKESSSTISNNDTNSINDESSTELEINNINNLTFGSNNSNINQKDDLTNCFALDLLNNNGSLQTIFLENNNTYILKLAQIDIEDHFFEQVEFAKKDNKNLNNIIKYNLKNTAPNEKFWEKRYYYYSKFDEGIQMDEESWFSVTPEPIAKYIAKLISGKIVIDGFCGSGGNVIQFSKYCKKVYAIDIEKNKIDICKNNCKVYECKDNIEFILSDFLKMKNKIKADYVFLSPPWGGPDYKFSTVYSIKKYMKPDIIDIVRVSLSVSKNILFYLPRNLDLDELFDICSEIKNEIEANSGKNLFFDVKILKSNDRIKTLLIIFGHNINEVFTKADLESFIEKYYNKIEDSFINYLYSMINIIGCYRFFKAEYNYRKNISKGPGLSYLLAYIKNHTLTEKEKLKLSLLSIKKNIKRKHNGHKHKNE